MVTPEEARKLAGQIDPIDFIVSDLENKVGNALRDLATQVESLQADAFKAGRESMRNQAAAVCNQMWEKCASIVKRVNDGLDSDVAYYAATNACDDCEDAIRKIEP